MDSNQFKGLRCLGLGRASSDPQAEDSIGQQLIGLQRACATREMHWVGFEQETVSGSEPGNRDDIARLLDRKKKSDDYDVLLVWDRSRLTRAGQEHGAWLKVEFGRVGVRVLSTTSKMAGSRYAWIEEGLEDEAAHDYVVKLSRNKCRGRQSKIQDGVLAYTEAPTFGIDRLHLNAEGKPLCVIRNLRDGRQERLDPETKEVLETYPREQKGQSKRHYRKQKTDRVVLVPGAEDTIQMVRFVMDQYYRAGLGYRRIALMMNKKGWLSPTGQRWVISAVRRIVWNHVYTGRGVSNKWATGKFHVCDRGGPREVGYDLYKMMGQKHTKDKLRPPEDWVIMRYPSLDAILPDDLRETVWQRQYDYWVKLARGLLPPPNRDKHRLSSYFLKHVLRCKHTRSGFVGRQSGPNWRYYQLVNYVNNPEPARPWLSKLVPAAPVESKVKSVIQEVFASTDTLVPTIRSIVEQEAKQSEQSQTEVASVEAERRQLEEQLKFTLSDLAELGPDALRKITNPLKERHHALGLKLDSLQRLEKRGRIDVDEKVREIAAELSVLGGAIEGMPVELVQSLLRSFVQVEVDLEKGEVEIEIGLPSWAIHRTGRISEIFSLEGSATCPQGNEAKWQTKVPLSSLKCLMAQEKRGRYRVPIIDCCRRAA